MAIIKKIIYKESSRGCGEKEILFVNGGKGNGCSHYGKQYRGFSKTINRNMLQQFHIWYLSEENENTNAKRYLYPFVHCSIIYNSYNMEISQVSTDG